MIKFLRTSLGRGAKLPLAALLRFPGTRGRLKGYMVAFALIVSLAAIACTQGSYPVDIFYEMHYQQSYKSHEPPRLSAPASSVAFFPGPKSTSFDTGQHLFNVNCSMCHGELAKGDGPVINNLINNYGYETKITPDLTTLSAPIIVGFLAAESRPLGPDSEMPPFAKLLSVDERNLIAEYVDSLPK